MPRRDGGFGPDDPRYQPVCIDGLATGSWEVGLREPIVLQPAGFGSMRWSAGNENAHVSRHVATAGGGWTGGCPAYELNSAFVETAKRTIVSAGHASHSGGNCRVDGNSGWRVAGAKTQRSARIEEHDGAPRGNGCSRGLWYETWVLRRALRDT